jgi:hypothetical protein
MYTDYPLTACFIVVLICVFGYVAIRTDSRDMKKRENLLDLARGFARMDKASRVVLEREPDWAELRRGIEDQICLISYRVDGIKGVAKIVASDGTMPFLFLKSTLPLLRDMYKWAQVGVVEEGNGRVVDALTCLDINLSVHAQDVVTETQWREFECTLQDIDTLRQVICLLGTERLLVRPWGVRARVRR